MLNTAKNWWQSLNHIESELKLDLFSQMHGNLMDQETPSESDEQQLALILENAAAYFETRITSSMLSAKIDFHMWNRIWQLVVLPYDIGQDNWTASADVTMTDFSSFEEVTASLLRCAINALIKAWTRMVSCQKKDFKVLMAIF